MYHNVMTLVEAVLELKNKLSQLPPEDYVVVVKVTDRVECVREVGTSGLTLGGKPLTDQPCRPQGNKGILGSPIPGSVRGQMLPQSAVQEEQLFTRQVEQLHCFCSLRMWG